MVMRKTEVFRFAYRCRGHWRVLVADVVAMLRDLIRERGVLGGFSDFIRVMIAAWVTVKAVDWWFQVKS